MAHYIVTAKIKKESVEKLNDFLNKDLFYNLQPFGRVLTFSLKNAKVLDKDSAVWEEEDYCTPPLKEEKEYVLDKFFDEIKVEKVSKGEGWEKIKSLLGLFNNLTQE